MGFVVRARGEVEVVRVARTGPVPEADTPEPVDSERLAVLPAKLALVLELAVLLRLEDVDPAVAEVADEQVTARLAEVGRGHGETPRRIQLPVLRHACEQRTTGPVLVDNAEPVAVDLVLSVGVLLGIRDEDVAVHVLDPERRVPLRELRVDEPAWDQMEAAVEDVHFRVVEVGRVELTPRNRQAL